MQNVSSVDVIFTFGQVTFMAHLFACLSFAYCFACIRIVLQQSAGLRAAEDHRTGRQLLGVANGQKLYLKNSRKNWHCKFHRCLRAKLKTKHYSQRVPMVGTVGYNIWSYWDLCSKQLSSFQNLRRKGGKFDLRPGGQRSCYVTLLSRSFCISAIYLKNIKYAY